MRDPSFFWAMAAVLASAACGSSVETSTGGTSTGAASPCPAEVPSGGVSCAGVSPGFRCTYGESVRPECRNDWTCLGGTWTTTKNVCLEPAPGACPASEPSGATCTVESLVCTFGSDLCLCTSCPGGCSSQPAWYCAPPPTGAGCPATVPNDGTACATPDASCTYGLPCGGAGAIVTCTSGTWLWATGLDCPG